LVPPDTIFGSLTIDGQNAPAGTLVKAMSMGEICDSQPYSGSIYTVSLNPSMGACWQPFGQIRFLVNGRFANQTIRPPTLVASQVEVDLTVGSGPTPSSASPSATSAPPAANVNTLTTSSSLKALALQQGDLPGYVLNSEDTTNSGGSLASYLGAWGDSNPSSTHLSVINILRVESSISMASGIVQGWLGTVQSDPGNSNVQMLPPQGIGDEEDEIYYQFQGSSGTVYDDYLIVFRRGTVTVIVDVADVLGTGTLARAVALARVIDGRVSGAVATTPTSPQPIAVPSGSGSGGCGSRGGLGIRGANGKCQ